MPPQDVSATDNSRNGSIANDVLVTNRRPFGYPHRGHASRRVTVVATGRRANQRAPMSAGSPTCKNSARLTHDELFGIGVLL